MNFARVDGTHACQLAKGVRVIGHKDRHVLGGYHMPFVIQHAERNVVIPVVSFKSFRGWGLTTLRPNQVCLRRVVEADSASFCFRQTSSTFSSSLMCTHPLGIFACLQYFCGILIVFFVAVSFFITTCAEVIPSKRPSASLRSCLTGMKDPQDGLSKSRRWDEDGGSVIATFVAIFLGLIVGTWNV